jgi:hypothetical protein
MRKSFKKKRHTLTKDPFSLLKQRRKRRTKKKILSQKHQHSHTRYKSTNNINGLIKDAN